MTSEQSSKSMRKGKRKRGNWLRRDPWNFMYLIFALFAAQTAANWAMYLDNQAATESVYLRLDSKIDSLDNKVDSVETGLRQEITAHVGQLRQEISEVRQEISDVRQEISEVRQEISDVRQEIAAHVGQLRQEISGLRQEIAEVRDSVYQLTGRLMRFETIILDDSAADTRNAEDPRGNALP